MTEPPIQSVTSLSACYANPRQGDAIYLQAKMILSLSDTEKQKLVADLKWLAEIGVSVITVSDDPTVFHEFSGLLTILEKQNDYTDANSVVNYLDKLATKPKRMVIVNQDNDDIEDFNKLADRLPSFQLYKFNHKQFQYLNQHMEQTTLPSDLNEYDKIPKSLGGGTHSTYKIRAQGKPPLVFKFGASQDAIKLEILTNAISRFLGVNIPASTAFSHIPSHLATALNLDRHGLYQVSEFIEPAKPQNTKNIMASAQKDFIVHALLGNIDVTKLDNFIEDKSGNIYLIDAGSNFIFRAIGERREEEAKFVTEVDSLRNNDEVKQAWFGNLTDAELEQQVKALLDKEVELEELIWTLADQLQLPDNLRIDFINLLSSRIDDLAIRFCPEYPRYAKQDRSLPAEQTSAGVLTYTVKDGETYVLLGQRVNNTNYHAEEIGLWDSLGGESKTEDIYLHNTAARQTYKTSGQQIKHSPGLLLNCPFHDIITEKNGKPFIYRMYFREHDYVDPSMLADVAYTAYQWVKASDLYTSLSEENVKDASGNPTVKVNHQGKTLILHPEFYQLLKQQNVKKQFSNLSSGQAPQQSHTQGTVFSEEHSNKSQRHLHSPEALAWQAKQSVLQHLQVINELKAKFNAKETQVQPHIESVAASESQSELHMRAVLGNAYVEDNLTANVKIMLDQILERFSIEISDEYKANLTKECIKFIEIEKQNPNEVYVYHGADDKITFLYDVYSAIHQLLQMNESWSAFRASNEFFKPFANIEAFRTYFINEAGVISNNAENYNEIAVATNCALFGNRRTNTSNSIYYLLTNHTTRPIDLAATLQKIFSSSALPEALVQPLLKVYETYYKEDNPFGVLYQIALPANKMDALSYASIDDGEVRDYKGVNELSKVFALLKADLDSGEPTRVKDAAVYLETLQARVMVPPHESFKVNRITSHDIKDTPQDKTISDFPALIADIVNNMLLNQTKDTLHPDTPAAKILAEVLSKNRLPITQSVSEMTLKSAIEKNEVNLVGKYLSENPSLLDFAIVEAVRHGKEEIAKILVDKYPDVKTKQLTGRTLYIPPSVHPDDVALRALQFMRRLRKTKGVPDIESIAPMPLFHLIAKHGMNQKKLMSVCFGDSWMHDLKLANHHTMESFIFTLANLPAANRYDYAVKYFNSNFFQSDLFDLITSYIPQNSLTKFFQHISHSIGPETLTVEIIENSNLDPDNWDILLKELLATKPQELPAPPVFATWLAKINRDPQVTHDYVKQYVNSHATMENFIELLKQFRSQRPLQAIVFQTLKERLFDLINDPSDFERVIPFLTQDQVKILVSELQFYVKDHVEVMNQSLPKDTNQVSNFSFFKPNPAQIDINIKEILQKFCQIKHFNNSNPPRLN